MSIYKRYIFLVVVIFSLINCFRKNDDNQMIKQYLDKTFEREKHYFYDEKALSLLKNKYKLVNLKDHHVYRSNKQVCIELYFSGKVTLKETRKAQEFYSHIISGSNFFYKPYSEINPRTIKEKIFILRIFVKDKLLLYRSYDFLTNEFDYFENMELKINRSNYYSNIDTNKFISEIKGISSNIKKVEVLKTLKGGVIYFRLRIKKNNFDNEISKLKHIIENVIAPELEMQDIKLNGMNLDYLGIVIDVKYKKDSLYKLLFFNGNRKEWINENWQKIDLFSKNSKI